MSTALIPSSCSLFGRIRIIQWAALSWQYGLCERKTRPGMMQKLLTDWDGERSRDGLD